MRDDEKIFREIADIYEKRYGRELLEEAEKLNKQDTSPLELRLEQRVRKEILARKRKVYMSVIAACAACIILFVSLPSILERGVKSTGTEPVASSNAPLDYEVIPLSATLPYGFTQTGFEQDKGKSVYYVEDIYSDDVVLTLEKSSDTLDNSGLTYISLDGYDAYGTSAGGYSLLTFTGDGVLYTMTCRYDINTLVRLGKGFV